MPFKKVGNIMIYYEVHGYGEPLVMISEYGVGISAWANQVSAFSMEYHVITFDNRGTGHSDKPDIPYTMQIMAEDVAGLLDAIGIEAAHILGYSTGGSIAQEFAITHPERVLTLILSCASPAGAPNEVVAKQSEHPTAPHSIIRQGEAILTAHTYDRLSKIKVPTLVLGGSADRVTPCQNLRLLASKIPNSELVILNNLGHGMFIEGAEQTNRVILTFLKQHSMGQVT